MNYDKLVNLIVEEVYKKINNINEYEKSTAVLVYEKDINTVDYLKDEFEVLSFDKSIKECDVVIVSRLCMRGICNLAIGNSTSDEERFILKMLMKGKKVYVLDEGIEYKKYKETAPKALYNKYLSYEDEILKFGIEIIKDIRTICNKSKQITKEDESKNEDIKLDDDLSLDLRNKKLISEGDIKKPMVNGIKNVIVTKKAIVTPLATDFMRIHHLKLKRM